MPQYKVSHSQLLQGRVVDEKLAAKYDALALRSGITELGWRDKNPTWLPTAYGMLKVTHIYGGFIVRRDDDPLIQAGRSCLSAEKFARDHGCHLT